jgi:hypothetical protein
MGRDPIVAKASELMRLDIMPSFDEIKNGKVGLTVVAPNLMYADFTGHSRD